MTGFSSLASGEKTLIKPPTTNAVFLGNRNKFDRIPYVELYP